MLEKLSAFEEEIVHVSNTQRLSRNSSSKGNQLKWIKGKEYIKLDCLGYEGVAEYFVTKLLECSDVRNFVKYSKCSIIEDGVKLGTGCISTDFKNGKTELTFGEILDSNLIGYSASYDEVRDIILDETGLDVKGYMDQILCLDAITMNDDRHFNNFALLYDSGGIYETAPIFDNGSSLLSDIITYPMTAPLLENMKRVQAKPFSTDFLRQLQFVTPLTLDIEKFFKSVSAKSDEEKRSLAVIENRFMITKNIAWQE